MGLAEELLGVILSSASIGIEHFTTPPRSRVISSLCIFISLAAAASTRGTTKTSSTSGLSWRPSGEIDYSIRGWDVVQTCYPCSFRYRA